MPIGHRFLAKVCGDHSYKHAYTYTRTDTRTHAHAHSETHVRTYTHTHTLSLSLYLSHSHTLSHTLTHTVHRNALQHTTSHTCTIIYIPHKHSPVQTYRNALRMHTYTHDTATAIHGNSLQCASRAQTHTYAQKIPKNNSKTLSPILDVCSVLFISEIIFRAYVAGALWKFFRDPSNVFDTGQCVYVCLFVLMCV